MRKYTIEKGKDIGALFLVITPLILIALDCYDVPARLGCNPIIKYKSLIYIAIGLYYSVIIYISQNNSANRQCNLIVEHIKQLDGIKPHEIKEECLKWLQNTEKDTHFICFYFPYSLVPCFWVDIAMNNQIIQKLRTLSCKDNLKLMFIGPSMETKNFKKFFNKVTQDYENAKKQSFHNPLWALCQTKQEIMECNEIEQVLRKLYEEEKQNLKELERNNLICVCEIKDDSFWDTSPDFSFVLRLTKTHEIDILISDTFNDVNMSSFSLSSHDEISLDAILNFPKTYQITDDRWKSIFTYSIFLNAIKKENELKNFIDNIYVGNSDYVLFRFPRFQISG